MMRTRHYIITGIIAYFVFLITTVPAAPVIGMFNDRIPVTISNVSGTLWSGRASTVTTKNNLTLKNVEWTFLPWRLLLANIAIESLSILINQTQYSHSCDRSQG